MAKAEKHGENWLQIIEVCWSSFCGEGRVLTDPKDVDFILKIEGYEEPMKDFK